MASSIAFLASCDSAVDPGFGDTGFGDTAAESGATQASDDSGGSFPADSTESGADHLPDDTDADTDADTSTSDFPNADEDSGALATTSGAASSGSSSDGEQPPDACEIFTPDECGACVNTECCDAAVACQDDPSCWSCVTEGLPQCDASAALDAIDACLLGPCAEPCGGGPPPPLDGVGATVQECQGVADFFGEINGVQPEANTAFASYSAASGTNIWIHSAALITEVNYLPDDGEWRTRVLITGSLGGEEYTATVAVTQYSDTSSSWQTVGYTDLGVVVVTQSTGVDPSGLLCSGVISGLVQAVFGGGLDGVAIDFVAPMLTADFPNAAG